MKISPFRLLLAAGAGTSVLAAPQPEITQRAVLPRANVQLLGWYSSTTSNGLTVYDDWLYDLDTSSYTTSSTWFRRCPVTSSCPMYTACSNGYMVAASTSLYCGAGGASSAYYCSSHLLYASKGAATAYSWYWCDQPPLTGVTFFQALPSDAAPPLGSNSRGISSTPVTTQGNGLPNPTPSSTPPSVSQAGSPSSTGPSTSSSSPAAPPPANDNSKSTPVGAIAGGVVGGVAVLAAVAFGIFFLLRRKKAAPAAAPASNVPVAQQWNPQSPAVASPPPNYAAPFPHGAIGVHEQKVPEMQHGAVGGNVYAQNAYNPHLSQHYTGAPHSPVGQGGQTFVGELPANGPGGR